MKTDHPHQLTRREFIGAAGIAATAALQPALVSSAADTPAHKKMIGIQVPAVSFVDEGTEQVLDIIQERGAVNTLFLATFSYGRGISGRQLPERPLPDHGKQEYDEKTFHGGNYATPHPQFYTKTSLKETRAPDHGSLDIVAEVLPKARQRGMKVYCWYEGVFSLDIPGVADLREVDWQGRRQDRLCAMHPDFREFMIGLTRDYCESYPIDGVMWCNERQGPLHTALNARNGRPADPRRVACFCEHHQKAARERGIDVKRSKLGIEKLSQFVMAAKANKRPTDGYFVEFWRLLLEYPELLAWEKLYLDGDHAVYGDVHRAAKARRPEMQVGFHIWHANSFSPFFRAHKNYAELAKDADFLKIAAYNNSGGPRYAEYIDNVSSTLFHDVPKEEVLSLHNHWLGYSSEGPLEKLRTGGLSADYVHRETTRALAGVQGKCKILPGIDIDVPTKLEEKQTSPDDVYAATTAALNAGSDGVIFSRKYSEMRLTNLSGGGKAVREFLK